MKPRWRAAAAIGIGIVVVAALVLAFADPLARIAVVEGAALFGYHVQAKTLKLNFHHATFVDVDVRSRLGEPILTARRVELEFSLRDLLPGSRRRLGLVSVDLDHPRLTVVRHPDGTYNIPIPSSSQPSGPTAPFDLTLRVRDGAATLDDVTRHFTDARKLEVVDVSADASLHPNVRSGYAATLILVLAGRRYPIEGNATLDDARGFEIQHWRASRIALGPLLDYAVNSNSLHPTGGELRALDVRLIGLPGKDGAIERRLDGTATLAGLTLEIGALAKPVRDLAGPLWLYDDGVAAPALHGTLAGTPLRIAGAIYNLARPTLRLGVVASGELAKLASVSAASAKLPLAGRIDLALLVEGNAETPLVLADARSPRVTYHGVGVETVRAQVALAGQEADLFSLSAHYAGARATLRGRFLLEKQLGLDLAARLRAGSATLPYLTQAIPAMALEGTATLTGRGTRFGGTGLVTGSSRTQRLAATFAIDPQGVGRIGPLTLEGPGNLGLYARVALDGPRHKTIAFLDARGVRLEVARDVTLPGIPLPALPPLSGSIEGAGVGQLEGKHVALAGNATVRDAVVAGIRIDEARTRAAGDLDRLSLTAIAARGPWGKLDGSAQVAKGRIALDGRYRGDLHALAQLSGGRVAMTGSADAPLRAIVDGRNVTAQLTDARFNGARVNGIAVSSLDGTVGVHGGIYDVYALDAGVAGARVVASGSLGDGGTVDLSTPDIALANVPMKGLPVSGGHVAAMAAIGGTLAAPQADAGVVLSGARFQRRPLAGSTSLTYANGKLGLADGLISFDGAAARVDGSVAGLLLAGPIVPRYDLDAHVTAAPVATLASGAKLPYPIDGSLDADVKIGGAGSSPSIAGRIAVPEGSVNGLHLRDASVAIAGTVRDAQARNGFVRVGGTAIAFSGALAGYVRRLHVSAPHADLADFDDFFDPGDMLAGKGSVAADVSLAPGTMSTHGNIALEGARYRRYRIGALDTHWNSSGRRTDAAVRVAASTGTLALTGSLTLPTTHPFEDPLHRAYLTVNASTRDLDVASWLAAAERPFPVVGKLNAQVRGNGRFPQIALQTNAELTGGSYGRIPIERLALVASASNGRATISSAVLSVPSLDVTASGSTGLTRHATFALRAQLHSPDLGKLATLATGQQLDLAGTTDSTLQLQGSLQRPRLELTLALDDVRYRTFQIPHVRAVATVDERLAELRSARISLANGEIDAEAHVPFDPARAHVVFGAPVVASLDLHRVDLGTFAGALPSGSHLGGLLDGHVGVAGTMLSPEFSGSVALAGGTYTGPQLSSPLQNVGVKLDLAGRTIRFDNLHANPGPGSIDGSGEVTVPDLAFAARDTTLSAQITARNAQFAVPKLMAATVDGNVTLGRAAAGLLQVGGALTIPAARINPNAFIPSGNASASKPPSFPLAFSMGVALGRDVRAQSGQVDVGAEGSFRIGGTLAAPTLDGRIAATDGTVSFYRRFAIESATLHFSPGSGVIPLVRAVATTHVPDPSTDVTLSVSGLATQLNVDLASDPTYDRSQILGLLVGAQQLGAVSGVASTSGQGPSVTGIVSTIAQGALANVFTRSLLQPLSSTVGGALGLQNLAINYDPTGGFAASARKGLGKNLDAVFAQSFGYPSRQSYGLEARPSRGTAIQLSFFQQQGSGAFVPQTLGGSTNQALTVSQPSSGTSGFSFVFKRKF